VNRTGSEPFWDVTPAAKCKGGAYFWQGDSPNSQMCRALANTPEGELEISGYNCAKGEIGQPGAGFVYTHQSGDNWTNEQCNGL